MFLGTHLRKYFHVPALCAAFLVMGVPEVLRAEEIEMKISTGFDYSEGDYGDTEDTNILYVPSSIKLTYGPWAAKVTVPYLFIEGLGSVIGEEGIIDVASGSVLKDDDGIGDVVTSLTYTEDIDAQDIYLDFTGKAKIPIADEDKGLGTGETDYTLTIDVTKVVGKASVYGGVGRKFVGKNSDLDLDNVWMLNVGADYQVLPKTNIGLSYDFRQSAGDGDNPSEITGYVNYKITDRVSLQLYGVGGLSDGSPDMAVGSQISYKFKLFE